MKNPSHPLAFEIPQKLPHGIVCIAGVDHQRQPKFQGDQHQAVKDLLLPLAARMPVIVVKAPFAQGDDLVVVFDLVSNKGKVIVLSAICLMGVHPHGPVNGQKLAGYLSNRLIRLMLGADGY